MFPNVPQEHRPLLEPHLREHVLPHVTQMQQQLAPFKPFTDAGVTAEDAAGLLKFAQDYEQDPLTLWVRMGQALQQDQKIHEDVDFEALAKLIRGEEIEDEPEPIANGQLTPEMQAIVAPLQQQIQSLQSRLDATDQMTEQQRQDAMLEQTKTQIRTALTEAGVKPELVTDELIVGAIFANRGNPQAAEKTLVDYWSGSAQARLDPGKPNGRRELVAEPPPTPPRASTRRGGSPADEFTKARGAAAQYLTSQIRSDQE